jgi:hypothetical protein
MGWYLACGVRQTLTASAASGLWKSASICVRMTTPRFRKSWKVGGFLLYRPSCQYATIIFRQVKAYWCKPFLFSIGKIMRTMHQFPG